MAPVIQFWWFGICLCVGVLFGLGLRWVCVLVVSVCVLWALRLCGCYWRFSVWFCLGLVRCEFVDLVVGLLAVWFLCLGWVSGSGLGLGWVWVVAFPWV